MSSGRAHAISWWLPAAAVALVAAGAVAWFLQTPTASTTTVADEPTSLSPDPTTGATLEPKVAAYKPGAPRRILIPELGVDTSVIPIRTVGDTLVPPSDPQQLGWWADGAKPGAKTGSALVTGHTVHTGGGALDDLETLERGDDVVLRTDKGRIRYVVDKVHVFSKGSVADHAERLFSQEVPGRLVLITCEDWDGTRYLSNVVVTATPSR